MTARMTDPAAAVMVLLTALLLVATPVLGDEADPEGCCICDCEQRATTSGVPAVPREGLCLDASSAACSDLCAVEGCGTVQFEPTECSAIPGCPQSAGVMAPAASPMALTGIAAALVMFGVAAVRRRGSRDTPRA